MLLVSCFKMEDGKLEIVFDKPVNNVVVHLLDKNNDLAPISATPQGNRLELSFNGNSAVFLVEFDA